MADESKPAKPADAPKAPEPKAPPKGGDKDTVPPPRAARDNRRIVQGVQLPPTQTGGVLKTFSVVEGASAEEASAVHDELEKVMTADQHKRLVEAGAIEGDWKPGAKTFEPMAGSRAEKRQRND